MRIISVTLRNCRLHRELKVDFDPARTLIGGPNETGKSTLIEAMHRALFLKAKGNTEQHRALISSLHPGHPEVEVAFEVGGSKYVLKKRFGSAGTTTLISTQSAPISGEQAETELARILKVEANLSGKAVTAQWAHLWVWQRQAGDDPSAHATAQCDGLLQRLQQMGGAAALQSELDARVAKHFADVKDQIYTQAGKPKAGSELERAENSLATAHEQLNLAGDRVQKLDSAATQLEDASRDLRAADASLEKLQKDQEQVEGRARQLGELKQQETKQSLEANEARRRCDTLEAANQQIFSTRAAIFELEQNLKPKNEAIAELEQSRDEAKRKASLAEQAYRSATEAARAARIRHELASAHALLLERTEVHAKLEEKAATLTTRRQDAANLDQQLAKLPKVDKTKLRELQRLENAESNARAALQAMAAGLEVVAADLPVIAGEHPIAVGRKQILTEDTEVRIGSAIRLRIQPGGGTSLAEARQAVEKAQADLRKMLDSLGLQSVQEAAEAYARRDELSSQINAVQAALQGMGADTVAEELQNSQNELAAAKGNVDRLAILAPDLHLPEDKAAAKALIKRCREELDDLEDKETQAKATRDRAGETLKSAEEKLMGNRTEVQQLANQLTGLNAQLTLLLQTHGDDTARSQSLLQAQSAKSTAANLLQAATDAIAALQPELLEGDIHRIKRAVQEETNKRNEARTQIAVAQAALRSDGSEDPQAALATAEAKARSATEYRDSVLRKAQAVALLAQLFKDEQRTLAEQFTRPLADKISGYLQCIFGVGAQAQVELQNNEFTGLRLYRPDFGGAAFAFDALSGGAREQIAAAVRLAMAEVLAGAHDGCLPVVFDDAFAYSDPERVNQLQRMLDLAATRGLQVIVLTCNPSDYAALGAKSVTLHLEQHVLPSARQPTTGCPVDSPDHSEADPGEQVAASATSVEVTDELRKALMNALSAGSGARGNQSLRQELAWDDLTYSRVKEDLVASGRLVPGKGRGGSVSLTGW